MKNNKWLCVECGKRKEEYEAMYCDNCFTKIFPNVNLADNYDYQGGQNND